MTTEDYTKRDSCSTIWNPFFFDPSKEKGKDAHTHTLLNLYFRLQSKIDEERALYDQERDSTDERFRALEMKIKGTVNSHLSADDKS